MSDSVGDDLGARIEAEVRADRRSYRRLAAVSGVVAGVIGIAVALWLAVAPERRGPPPPGPVADSSGLTGPMFDFSDAITLRPDNAADLTRFTIPPAVGAVERIALVRCDLGATLWEATATPAERSGPIGFTVGTAPEGFTTTVALDGSARRGLLVVNGSSHLGLSIAGCR